MPIGIDIKPHVQAAIRHVQGLAMGVDGRRVRDAAGESVRQMTRRHFGKLSAERHRPGKRGEDFYGTARESVVYKPQGKSARIAVTAPRGLRQRYTGGTINAKPGKSLAIPVHPSVIGVRAREVFDELGLVAITNARGGVLMRPEPGKAFGTVFYALTKSVTQSPDPSVLPTKSEVANAAEDGVTLAIKHLKPKS